VTGKGKKQSAAATAKQRDELLSDARKKQSVPDPLSPENLKKLGMRLGIPVALGWVIAAVIGHWIAFTLMGVITVAIAGVLVWALRYAQKSRAVVDILKGADTPEGRKEALQKLESGFKKDDAAAVFARAQLEMQEDPRAALKTLEQINLSKVMAHVADEARGQRAMIHLILGETDEARALVDGIDLSRHQDNRSRATLTAIIGEAWARSGQAKRAIELLAKLDPEDPAYEDLKPQLYRARACNDEKNDLRLSWGGGGGLLRRGFGRPSRRQRPRRGGRNGRRHDDGGRDRRIVHDGELDGRRPAPHGRGVRPLGIDPLQAQPGVEGSRHRRQLLRLPGGHRHRPRREVEPLRHDRRGALVDRSRDRCMHAHLARRVPQLALIRPGRHARSEHRSASGSMQCRDCLVEINPATGAIMTSYTNLGYDRVFGTAFWAGSVYGFTTEGELFEVTIVDGELITTPIDTPQGLSFWGAGSTTSAPPVPQ